MPLKDGDSMVPTLFYGYSIWNHPGEASQSYKMTNTKCDRKTDTIVITTQQQHQLHYTSVSEYNTIGWDGKCQYALQRDAFRESF